MSLRVADPDEHETWNRRRPDVPHFIHALGARPQAALISRALTRAALKEWDLPHRIEDAELVTSELVTNALVAEAQNLVLVLVHEGGSQVSVSVWDDAPGRPEPQDVDYVAEDGRGLLIVGAVSSEWGCQDTGALGGKIVWAKIGPAPEGV